jgi:hypothetical protein
MGFSFNVMYEGIVMSSILTIGKSPFLINKFTESGKFLDIFYL